MKELPENSLALLDHLGRLQKHPNFKYLEFDVRETKDKKLVVFHDRYILRMLPNEGYNIEVYKELRSTVYKGQTNKELSYRPYFLWRISDLTLDQLQTLSLEGREPVSPKSKHFQVPTLEHYIKRFEDKVTKPVVFEVKELNSREGREAFTDLVIDYAEKDGGNKTSSTRYNEFPYQRVSIINLTGAKNVFVDVYPVCKKLKEKRITIYRGWTHDSLCDFFYTADKSIKPVRMLKNGVKRLIQQVAVKHEVELIESELDATHYHKPRLVHYEPRVKRRGPRFVYNPVEKGNEVLERLKEINAEKLIIFVHGRGRHPKKGERIVSKLASTHNAAILMFNWDSWICKSYCEEFIKPYSSKYPVGNARAAADDLGKLMTQLKKHSENNPKVSVSILVHSMGNIVFKEMIEKPAIEFSNNTVFVDNLILNSADVDYLDHKQWLSKVSFAEDVFVTTARKDFALGAVELMLFKPRLGQGFASKEGSIDKSGLVENVHYVDFTNVYSSHRKFGVPQFKTFFKSALGNSSWVNCLVDEPIDMDNFDYACTQQ